MISTLIARFRRPALDPRLDTHLPDLDPAAPLQVILHVARGEAVAVGNALMRMGGQVDYRVGARDVYYATLPAGRVGELAARRDVLRVDFVTGEEPHNRARYQRGA